ncbi:AraC family transcriptional regulator [Runella slithyformis]|uniref:Transcriptional regulator, AraC family n=1 Tax=Runella slithyformis (strain ATCC 29530 / DSM 19594 / LMG 11500 / NCIMB 11436 / LSU 4) TaxID=761193 RepID=A0A7U3ZM29_RUNSL|nr:AraC family transcriptional regulator [Runella slithyformis]AEI49682.1 transcriptional regulator, AraC family [Runella slithyformis DSM 19594]
MRPNRLTVPQTTHRSFDIRHEQVPYFTHPWHYHPELELNYIVESTGTRFIGQSVERFEKGEVVLLGKNLPHYWKNDASYYQPSLLPKAQAIIVRFTEDFAGVPFFKLPETKHIDDLFEKAIHGLKLLEPLRSQVAEQLHQLLEEEGFSQLMTWVGLLDTLAKSNDVAVISPNYLPMSTLTKNNERMNRVMAYLLDHFTEPITLQVVAELGSMNESAFCRYFKAQTGQTLNQYITDLRIRYACELLSKSKDSITQICFQVGFENVSHFIHVFKKVRHQTPFEFRRKQKVISKGTYSA